VGGRREEGQKAGEGDAGREREGGGGGSVGERRELRARGGEEGRIGKGRRWNRREGKGWGGGGGGKMGGGWGWVVGGHNEG